MVISLDGVAGDFSGDPGIRRGRVAARWIPVISAKHDDASGFRKTGKEPFLPGEELFHVTQRACQAGIQPGGELSFSVSEGLRPGDAHG